MGSERSWQGLGLRAYRRGRRLLIFVLLALPLSATTYYVDNCVTVGSDSNNGMSTSTPWLTINKVNTSTFSAGDLVLFQRTCVWREQLTVPSSGSAGNVITIGAYGSGILPIINGANFIAGWSLDSGTTYSAADSTQPYVVTVNGVWATQGGSPSSLNNGQWFWTGNTLYLRSDSGSPAGVEAGARNSAIIVQNGINYITIDGLSFTSTNESAIRIDAADHVTVQNSSFTLGTEYRGVVGEIHFSGTNGTANNNTFTNIYTDAIYSQDTASFTAKNNTVSSIYGAAANGAANCIHYAGVGSPGVVDIENNSCDMTGSNSIKGAITVENAASGVVRHNSVNHGRWGVYPDSNGLEVAYNLFTNQNQDAQSAAIFMARDQGAWGLVTRSANVFHHNVISGASYGIVNYDAAGPRSGFDFYNNTIYGCAVAGWANLGAMSGEFKNNILWNSAATSGEINWDAASSIISGETWAGDYNVIGPEAASFIRYVNGNTYNTLAAYVSGASQDAHSTKNDPKFTNTAGNNFSLQSSSSAINAGSNLGTEYQFGLDPRTNFPWGTLNQNNQGSGWEIGAFVFVQQIPPAPPTSLSVTVQ